jgi:hypothetical protein
MRNIGVAMAVLVGVLASVPVGGPFVPVLPVEVLLVWSADATNLPARAWSGTLIQASLVPNSSTNAEGTIARLTRPREP